jgi:hypothetical protein
VIDRRQIQSRVKILRETRQILHKLSKQSSPRGLSRRDQAELKKYDNWLSVKCKELDKLSKQGEKLLKLKHATEEMQQSFNLQYLQLQQNMQQQNRQFTLVSNIMKVKHDTTKAAINNIR